jgi:hypothetical protein
MVAGGILFDSQRAIPARRDSTQVETKANFRSGYAGLLVIVFLTLEGLTRLMTVGASLIVPTMPANTTVLCIVVLIFTHNSAIIISILGGC